MPSFADIGMGSSPRRCNEYSHGPCSAKAIARAKENGTNARPSVCEEARVNSHESVDIDSVFSGQVSNNFEALREQFARGWIVLKNVGELMTRGARADVRSPPRGFPFGRFALRAP